MKLRQITAAVIAASTLALVGATAAYAADATGPDTAACSDATAAVASLQAQIDAWIAGPPGTPSLADLQKAVVDAIAADNAAGATVDSQATIDAKAALAARQKLIDDTTAKLNPAIVDRDLACAAPTNNGGATTTTPTTTTKATTTPAPTTLPLPPANFSQVGEVPHGAIDTGRA